MWRQPFPGPGLGIRIVGEVTGERLEVLRRADAIARAELSAAGLDRDIWQCPVVLLADVRSVGVQGDGRTYGHPVVLRPVSSEDAMTADWTRVPYDVLETDLDPHHQRGARGQPGRPGHHVASRPAPSSGSEPTASEHRSRAAARSGASAEANNRIVAVGLEGGDEPDPRRWLALLTCCSALFMTLLDVSVTNVALPSIGRATDAGPSQLQWVVSGYTLAFGLVPVLAGRLGDDHGRRLMFQVGVGSFAAHQPLAGLSRRRRRC